MFFSEKEKSFDLFILIHVFVLLNNVSPSGLKTIHIVVYFDCLLVWHLIKSQLSQYQTTAIVFQRF